MPGVVGPWGLHQADLADDLHPELQGGGRLLPVEIGNVGPVLAGRELSGGLWMSPECSSHSDVASRILFCYLLL